MASAHSRRSAPRPRTWLSYVVVLTVVAIIGVVGGLLWGTGALAPGTAPKARPTSKFVRAPGGPFLYDPSGRVLILHGVNAVYKRAPFELYPDPGEPWDFSSTDVSQIAALGFNVVRLGISWQGLEPGVAPANDPTICDQGPPRNPDQFNRQVFDTYLARVERTVGLLARAHIYTILDMHQDIYSELFGGDGAPDWAVCTDGPIPAGSTVFGPAFDAALENFWTNDVVGDLQGQYDEMWALVAHAFRQDPWVLGYDPFNEPYVPSSQPTSAQIGQTNVDVECFYTGRAHPGLSANRQTTLTCPPDDPAEGLIPTILRADPHHLLFVEPMLVTSEAGYDSIGPIDAPNLVFNFHDYCSDRSLITGTPTNVEACSVQAIWTIAHRGDERPQLATPMQPHGPAWFMSEFGATTNVPLISTMTADADRHRLGWTLWSWKRYADPVTGADKSLITSSGTYQPTVAVLSRTYAQAVAGVPTSMSYNWHTGRFLLTYTPSRDVSAPTVVFVATDERYPHGYCARVSGGTVISKPDSDHLEIANAPNASSVDVAVIAGDCRSP